MKKLAVNFSPVRPDAKVMPPFEADARTTYTRWSPLGHAGELWMISERLETCVWRGGKWLVKVSRANGEKIIGGWPQGAVWEVVSLPAEILAIGANGATFWFRDGAWSPGAPAPSTWGRRSFFRGAHDPKGDRVVAWGGMDDRRQYKNDVHFIEKGKWKPASESPPALRYKDDAANGHLAFDYALDCVVRLVRAQLDVLRGEAWTSYVLPGETLPRGPLFSDPKTRETLFCYGDALWRLHETKPVALARFAIPKGKELAFVAETRTVHTQSRGKTNHTTADLGPVFDAAAALRRSAPRRAFASAQPP